MQATKSRHRSGSRSKGKKNKKSTPNSLIETKNKFKNIEQMEIETLNTHNQKAGVT